MFFKRIIFLLELLQFFVNCAAQQQAQIKLEQGILRGLKVFPDGSQTACFAFLGVPYAQPPLNELRFAPPQPHSGWNATLHAITMKPVCPQLANTIYDESSDGSMPTRIPQPNENCLYLNIWVPETGGAIYAANLPVLVVVTGEDMAYDWTRNRVSGLDFATDGVLVVSIQYRTNIFGWINLQNKQLPGNYGLQDVQLAMQWIENNIKRFGGNSEQITLLGHGSSGVPIALAASLTETDKSKLISKLILMSGADVPYALGVGHQARIVATSQILIQKLGCHFEEQHTLSCLRTKSISDLLQAYETVKYYGNSSLPLGIMLESTIGEMLTNTSIKRLPPLIVGIASNEGAFMRNYWLDLAREGAQSLSAYINDSVLPNALKTYSTSATQIAAVAKEALNWHYFGDKSAGAATQDVVAQLLLAMQRLISESSYETPFYALLKLFQARLANNSTYVYIFHNTKSMDMRGRINLFGGASHTSDLPLLFGPGLFQQIARRRFNTDEERLYRKMRNAFVNYVKQGNPTPDRIYDAWQPYRMEHNFIYNLGEQLQHSGDEDISVLQQHKAEIEQLLSSAETPNERLPGYTNPYRQTNLRQNERAKAATRAAGLYYQTNTQDSGYALHLQRVYGFWRIFLPSTIGDEHALSACNAPVHRLRLMEAAADASRYRQGFFALLLLVCLLLACLGLCIYLLRREVSPSSTASERRRSGCCL